jgi:hypothetical protein
MRTRLQGEQMIELTTEQWKKFERYIQPGCRCRTPSEEGILLENWPYSYLENWTHLGAIMMNDAGYHRDRKECYLRFQPFNSIRAMRGSIYIMRFFMRERWHTLDSILALPDE